MRKSLAPLSLAFVTLVFAGCPELEEVCVEGDSVYQVGDSFKSSDGCNTCTCEEGGTVSCTAMGCLEGCDYKGAHYAVGDKFDDEDGCNTCSCVADGQVSCTEMACQNGCDYAGAHYAVGDRFDATDGCNTCTCVEDGQVSCTEMACGCGPLEQMFEPGCGGEDGVVQIDPGCYQPCGPYGDAPCANGICQRTDINPCVCAEGAPCCDACGEEYWLCLPVPEKETCLSRSRDPIIASATRSFGECLGQCKFDLTIAAGAAAGPELNDDACDAVTLDICDWGQNCSGTNKGVLTPVGHVRVRALAAELLNVELQKTYGCPDCADGGASGVTLVRYGKSSSHAYEFSSPPKPLAEIDALTQGLINALVECKPNDNIEISAGCTPRGR